MCWIGKLELKEAKEDIPIVKIMLMKGETLLSLYQCYPYILNKKIKSEILEEQKYFQVSKVNIALHSYDKSIKIISEEFCKAIVNICYDNRIISSLIISSYGVIKVNGIIPKGAKYCKNKKGEYISNELILQEITNEIQTIAANI